MSKEEYKEIKQAGEIVAEQLSKILRVPVIIRIGYNSAEIIILNDSNSRAGEVSLYFSSESKLKADLIGISVYGYTRNVESDYAMAELILAGLFAANKLTSIEKQLSGLIISYRQI